MWFKTLADSLEQLEAVDRRLRKTGDLGLVAERLASAGQRPVLRVQAVYRAMLRTAQVTGAGAVDRKVRLLAALLRRATATEAKYFVRILQGRLRLDVGDQTILVATAVAVLGDARRKAVVEHAYNVRSDLGGVARLALSGGERAPAEAEGHGGPGDRRVSDRARQAGSPGHRVAARSSVRSGARSLPHGGQDRIGTFGATMAGAPPPAATSGCPLATAAGGLTGRAGCLDGADVRHRGAGRRGDTLALSHLRSVGRCPRIRPSVSPDAEWSTDRQGARGCHHRARDPRARGIAAQGCRVGPRSARLPPQARAADEAHDAATAQKGKPVPLTRRGTGVQRAPSSGTIDSPEPRSRRPDHTTPQRTLPAVPTGGASRGPEREPGAAPGEGAWPP